jgi:response regulator RpfG family c-di-GMP phosphodiesterase
MSNEQQKFQQIIDMSLEFAKAKDIDMLLKKVLGAAQKIVNAESGSIYLQDQDSLHLHHTQNEKLQQHMAPEDRLIYKASLTPANPKSVPAHVAKTGQILNIPDVSKLPDDVPYSLNRLYGNGVRYRVQSVLAFPLHTDNEQLIGVIHLINPRNEAGQVTPVAEDDTTLIQLFAQNAANAIERARATRARIMGILQILTKLRNTEETISHFNRVGAFSAEIYETWARHQGIAQATIESQKDTLRLAAMLHDIGKLAIPNLIRRKPGRLTEDEYETMKQHTVKGAQLLLQYSQSEIEQIAAEIALNHHEHWDGTGYPGHISPETGQPIPDYTDESGKPRGKKGEEIPVFGRVVAIADVYDALTSSRVYREAWKEEDVLQELKKGAGTKFDPEMIEAFFASLDTIRAIARRFPD